MYLLSGTIDEVLEPHAWLWLLLAAPSSVRSSNLAVHITICFGLNKTMPARYVSSLAQETDLSKCIPLIIHGDDAESHRRRSFMVCSFASVLNIGCSPWESRFVMYCLDNARSCDSTIDTCDTWLVWSLAELIAGRWFPRGPWNEEMPSRLNRSGQLIANGYRGIPVFHRGDEKYMQKCYHMATSWVSERVCWSCHASRLSTSDLLYTTFGPNAKHRTTLIGPTEFIEKISRRNAWVQLPGFHTDMLCYDLLHVFDLTLVPDAAASVPWLHMWCWFTAIIPIIIAVHLRPSLNYLQQMKCGQAGTLFVHMIFDF